MLHKNIVVRESKMGGLGLFASDKICKGEIVWQQSVALEKEFTEKELEQLSDYEKNLILKYSIFWDDKYTFYLDEAKYFNHSCDANTVDVDVLDSTEYEVAMRDIGKGEEVTWNYLTCKTGAGFVCRCGSQNCVGRIFSGK